MLDVFFAAPDELDRATARGLRSSHGLFHIVGLTPPAEAAAEVHAVHDDALGRSADHPRSGEIGRRPGLTLALDELVPLRERAAR